MSLLNTSTLKTISQQKHFSGLQIRVEHESAVLQCTMSFSVFLPPQASAASPVPVLYWLTGLTGTDENFSTKSGAQRVAAQLGIALVIPDTSPRGEHVPNDEAYDLGQGAGFYLNATQAPWNKNFRMFDYISAELPALIEQNFPVNGKRSISGHSMGGHGALMIAAKVPGQFLSVSAFAPIANPINCPWGQKAFSAYLGQDQENWKQYDSVELLSAHGLLLPLLVDTGTADEFLEKQLNTEALVAVAARLPDARVRYQDGYDHSYYFVSTFMEEHLRFHAQYLIK
jgi:S-formylglutathione hydrolase